MRKGFTAVELLVSFGIFSVIVSVVTSIFVTSVRSSEGITSLVTANDNTYLMLEQVARELRVGIGIVFRGDMGGGKYREVEFKNRRGDIILYRYNEPKKQIERSGNGGSSFAVISGSSVRVDDFFITTTCPTEPVRATLHLAIGAKGVPSVENVVNEIQTTVATRNLARCNF